MSLRPIRPRFELRMPTNVEDSIARLAAAAETPERRCVMRVLAHHVDLTVVREDRHRWSPCMQIDFVDQEGDGTLARGLVGPHPNVWTFFAFVYATIATASGFALLLGLVQLALEQTPWGLWLVPAGILLGMAMYAVAQAGQRLAAQQTRHLHEIVRGALTPDESDPGETDRGA